MKKLKYATAILLLATAFIRIKSQNKTLSITDKSTKMKTYQSDNQAWRLLNELLPEDFQIKDNHLPVEEVWEWKGNKIHLDRYPNPDSKYRIFLHHGVGTNGRQLNMIFGHKMAELGYDVVAIDNLGYGMTEVFQKDITYDDWVHLFADFVNAETKRDHKKTILYGLSAGGMLIYNSSAFIDEVDGMIGMCFLQNDNKTVGNETSKYKGTNWLVVPLMKKLAETKSKTHLIAMKNVSKMKALVNNEKALEIFLKDDASAGAKVQLQFLADYMTYKAPIPVNQYNKAPILLTQPELDRWTPLKLSEISMKGIKAPFTVKLLEGAGHYPIEEKGLRQLIQYSDDFIKSLP
ncbi:alpha/beta fold hydrolase [Chryseobacterium sp.]|uniref:alpha/beta hydrolase n=1 Tax=Chryseobacterium sp. TaxID=1871047 RepID=UPI0025BD762D|nr:alpha/beta fold hydrolase [Chryseobacterium sp.]MBV8325198.1 alpha/beta fold hydrolase [Chryseobacterium sp.]